MKIYEAVKILSKLVCYTFFNEIRVIGKERLPPYGPVIFVGNHHNKFVDACVIMAFLPRQLRFLIATKSLKALIIGSLARFAGAIGVTRAQDLVFTSTGRIRKAILLHDYTIEFINAYLVGADEAEKRRIHALIENYRNSFSYDVDKNSNDDIILCGTEACRFTTELKCKDRVKTKVGLFSVLEVIDERVIIVQSDITVDTAELSNEPMKILPKVNHFEVYENVNSALMRGESICIFPEGGSHDQPGLLPLKPGVAVMALTAASIGVEDVLIVPCGIHYQDRQRFGSNAVLEIGKPIAIKEEQIKSFVDNPKTSAIDELLIEVKRNLEDTIIYANDTHTLNSIKLAAKLYVPDRHSVTTEKDHNLQTLFTKTFRKTEKDPRTLEILNHLDKYNKILEYNGISDSEVHTLNMDPECALYYLVLSAVYLLFLLAYSLPTGLIVIPLRYVLDRMTEAHRRACMVGSNVKITGADVIASYKILWFVAAAPTINLIGSIIVAYLLRGTGLSKTFIGLMTFMILPLLTYVCLRLEQNIIPTARYIVCCYKVFISGVNVWGSTEMTVLADRIETQLKVRAYVRDILVGNEALESIRYDFDRITPFTVLEADTRRLERNKSQFYYPAVPQLRVFSREEII